MRTPRALAAAEVALVYLLSVVTGPIGSACAQSPVPYRVPLDGSPRITAWVDHQCARYTECEDGYMVSYTGDRYTDCSENSTDPWRGPYCYDGHPGIDYSAAEGTPVLAAAQGTVAYSGLLGVPGLGETVIVNHSDGYRTLYCHLQGRLVSQGAQVAQGAQIGTVGNTGTAAYYLHFEVRKASTNKPTDPFGWRGNGADPLAAAGAGGEASVCRWQERQCTSVYIEEGSFRFAYAGIPSTPDSWSHLGCS